MAIETLLSLFRQAGHEPPPVPFRQSSSPGLKVHASAPYEAGATGRRASGWNTSRLGPTTLLWGHIDQIRSRCRDAIRNNPWAANAIDKFESNVVGAGIQPHWQHPDEKIRLNIQQAFSRWNDEADYAGQSSFYGLQALVAREVFEAGEVLIRYRVRPSKDRMFIPLQLQLIEGEQLPVFVNMAPGGGSAELAKGNAVRTGIEFDQEGRRVAYRMYKEHPGETMFFPLQGLTTTRVPAEDVSHVYKPLRAGQLRGQPALTAVLTLLYELDQYSDAELVRKKVSTMFAAFIKKPTPEGMILPPDPNGTGVQASPSPPNVTPVPDLGTETNKIEPGTMQDLFPGEEIVFPEVPPASDFASFLNVQLHKFAAGVGLTYEQLTGDLRGVNYSSIRAGLLEFRRACEQFQYNVIVHMACRPIAKRWLKEAVLCGALTLPGYADNPWQYEDIIWVPPGWDWVNPKDEYEAYQGMVRSGFTSRTIVVRSQGRDPDVIDAQQAEERARAAKLGLTYDSDPNKVLIGRETQPLAPSNAKPTRDSAEESDTA